MLGLEPIVLFGLAVLILGAAAISWFNGPRPRG